MDDMLADFQIVGLIENGMLADFQVVSPIEDVLLVQDVYQIETKWSCSASAVPHYKRWSDLRTMYVPQVTNKWVAAWHKFSQLWTRICYGLASCPVRA